MHGGPELRDTSTDSVSYLPDLSETPLDQIARLCDPSGDILSPEGLAGRPVLRAALLRVRREATQAGECYSAYESGPGGGEPTLSQ